MFSSRKSFELWRSDLMAFSGALPSQFSEAQLRRFHSQGCEPQMIRALQPDSARTGHCAHEVNARHAELGTIRAFRDKPAAA